MLVENDEVDREPLHPPILVRPEQLPHDAHVVGLVDSHEHDREVAGYPVSPQRSGALRLTRKDLRGRPQGPIRVENAAGEALEKMRLVRADAEVVLLHLRLRPGQGCGAVERRRIVIFLGEGEGLRTRRRDERREGSADGIARRQSHTAAQAHDRIEHRAGRVGQWPAVDHRRGRPDPAPAAEEPRTVLPRPPHAPARPETRRVTAAGVSPAASRARERIRSRHSDWKTPGGPRRSPAAPERPRRTTSPRSPGSSSRDS